MRLTKRRLWGLSGFLVLCGGLHALGLLWVIVALALAFAPFLLIVEQVIVGEPPVPNRR